MSEWVCEWLNVGLWWLLLVVRIQFIISFPRPYGDFLLLSFFHFNFIFNFHFNFSLVLFRCLAENRTQWKRRTRLKKNSNSESHVTTSVCDCVCGFFVVHFESWSFTVYGKHNWIGHGGSSSSSSSQYSDSAYKIAIKQLVEFSKTNCCSSRFILVWAEAIVFRIHTLTHFDILFMQKTVNGNTKKKSLRIFRICNDLNWFLCEAEIGHQ